MGEWETEDEYAAAAHASLPKSTDTPYRTPSLASRRSNRQKSNSPGPSSSPPDLPSSSDQRGSRDIANDESISILDPRRFTPTLHANLVSEILALRRDQEEKTKVIEKLEGELHDTRGEHETLEAELVATAKECRKQQRQLALLEGGTSSALSELARERDDAVETTVVVQKRLDAVQKKIRAQEEDADRVQGLWSRDKDNWEDEKRKYERKIHIAESRLKIVLEEVAAYEASQNEQPQTTENETEPPKENGNDNASIRTMSMTDSIRFSMLSGPNGYSAPKLNGMSLADELDFDAESEEGQTDIEGRESVMSWRHKRNQSRESMMSKTHRRNQSIESVMLPGSVARGRILANQGILGRVGIVEGNKTVPQLKVEYVDTGVQFSPPPSPKLPPTEPVSAVEPLPAGKEAASESGTVEKQNVLEGQHREMEIEANQRRKRVHASPLIIDAGSQTLEDPLSPPRTPASPTRAPPPPPTGQSYSRTMTSSYTQTDAPELKSLNRALPLQIPIPQIQLHPPKSRPPTPHTDHIALLPQHSKDAGCQANMPLPVPSRSMAVQTEEIRVDKRMNLLPPHLHPSAISSQPPSPEPTADDFKRFSPVPGNLPPRNPLRRMRSQNSVTDVIPSSPPQLPSETRDAYPGNNDDGPLAIGKSTIRRPHRISSLFAGFDNVSSDDADEFGEADMSDSDYRTALSAPKPQSASNKAARQRISSAPPASVPEGVELSEVSKPKDRKSGMRQLISHDGQNDFSFPDAKQRPQQISMKSLRQLDKPLTLVTTAKPAPMRRAALIQSGVAAHQGRQSPGLSDSATTEPPFPIPTRASSRQPPYSVSAPSDGNRSPTPRSGDPWSRGGRGLHNRSGSSVRKVRSAAALPRGGSRYRRRDSRSPPPMSGSTEAPESPKLPPMPQNDITSPRYMQDTNSTNRYRSHRYQPSTNTANTANTANTVNTVNTANTTNTGSASIATNGATTVVDAIAQTMVGEWMFKYVRRRKSFGVSDTNGGEENSNGVRHRRWVWLAPYERAVMWSSKQPTSGSALLGKTGRKLCIQSVLDVKDDNPTPKGAMSLFNRSILILTPARALKFTAVSAERHYVWLTALSFLAHSSQAVPEIVATPPPLPQVPNFEIPLKGARLRKNMIRDSIRVAKGKTVAARPGPTSVHSSSQYGGTDQSIREEESYFTDHPRPRISESAEPPAVPRFTERGYERERPAHGRKRSHTGPRVPPPLSFRGFSGPAPSTVTSVPSHAPSSSIAGQSTGSSDIYQSQPGSSVAPSGYTGMSVSGRSSIRTSDASGRPGVVVNNFFDAVGTVRMEAFISPMALTRFDDFLDEQDEMNLRSKHRRRSRERRRRRSRNRDSHYVGKGRPNDDWYGGSRMAGEEEYHRDSGSFAVRDDPFRGF